MEKEYTNIKHKRRDMTVYVVLRALVIIVLVLQILNRNFENVFLCILTLGLLILPILIDHKLNIKLPSLLETMIFLFIFAAEILGEVYNFYGHIKNWDMILHTINGFLCAAIGFSLVDILNQTSNLKQMMSPLFVALVAFCVSMTIGVFWEFIEFSFDSIFKFDMQKDTAVNTISSVSLNEETSNKTVILEDISKTEIYSLDDDGNEVITTIEGGYLDIGLVDTMEDLFVNFIGAIIFSTIGYLYIKNRDKYKFAENFMPTKKTDEEIEFSKKTEEAFKRLKQDKKETRSKKKSKDKSETASKNETKANTKSKKKNQHETRGKNKKEKTNNKKRNKTEDKK